MPFITITSADGVPFSTLHITPEDQEKISAAGLMSWDDLVELPFHDAGRVIREFTTSEPDLRYNLIYKLQDFADICISAPPYYRFVVGYYQSEAQIELAQMPQVVVDGNTVLHDEPEVVGPELPTDSEDSPEEPTETIENAPLEPTVESINGEEHVVLAPTDEAPNDGGVSDATE